jgi:orotidine-5'-phosphate decarboxylase
MAAAAAGRGVSNLRLLAVSVLTSMDDADAARAGYGLGVADLVRRRARQAQEARMDGLVCAATEIEAVRATVGQSLVLVVPGIRPAGSAAGDQKRVMTPGEAIALGAEHLVVGRPISQAADPAAAARAIVAEISRAA